MPLVWCFPPNVFLQPCAGLDLKESAQQESAQRECTAVDSETMQLHTQPPCVGVSPFQFTRVPISNPDETTSFLRGTLWSTPRLTFPRSALGCPCSVRLTFKG